MAKARLSVVLATDSRDPSGIGHHMLTLAAGLAGDCRVALVFPDADGGPAFVRRARAAGPRRRRDRHRGRGLFSRRSRGAVARCAARACGHRLGGAGTCGVGPRGGRRGRPHGASALAHHRSRAGGGLRAGSRERGRLRLRVGCGGRDVGAGARAVAVRRSARGDSQRRRAAMHSDAAERHPRGPWHRSRGGARCSASPGSRPRRTTGLSSRPVRSCARQGRMVRLVAGRRWAGSGRPRGAGCERRARGCPFPRDARRCRRPARCGRSAGAAIAFRRAAAGGSRGDGGRSAGRRDADRRDGRGIGGRASVSLRSGQPR